MALARTVGRYLRNPAEYTTQEFIDTAEKAAKEHPGEWVIFYSVADKYMAAGQYVRALEASKRCVDLRPNDLRSRYALATAYNILTRAEWTMLPSDLAHVVQLLATPGVDLLDPANARTEMEEIGMVVDTAAAQAIRWFENALKLDPDEASAVQIAQDLATLYERFPHLRF
jgi:tetratricopeptide (TPR) repeat protein